jgi:hypothetical protein
VHLSNRMKTIVGIFLVTCALVMSCDNKDNIDSFLEVDVAEFNQRIEKGVQHKESWVDTPYLIVNELFGPGYNSEGRQTFIFEQYEGESSLTVIVTHEGLLDDSVAGEKRIIEFKFDNEVWIIVKIRLGMKCHEYRGGHTNYSGDVCS